MTGRGRFHLKIYVFPSDWQLWPIYAPKEEAGVVYLGPVVIRWHWDWMA